MVVTSPPYYALRDYGINGQIGLEKRADCLGWAVGNPCGECYICHLVEIFREVKRVLRKDGVCFLNIGDSYATDRKGSGGRGATSQKQVSNIGSYFSDITIELNNTKPKDMFLIPSRLALALQADGWWIRSDIIWSKTNIMPESVKDRPTKSHEYIWLLTKNESYFWNSEAAREESSQLSKDKRATNGRTPHKTDKPIELPNLYAPNATACSSDGKRNIRTVWTISTQPYKGAHYATFPEALVERCIRAGTSEYGVCPNCGKQWKPVIDRIPPGKHESEPQTIFSGRGAGADRSKHARPSVNTVVGFAPSCSCGLPPTPAIVLDPFVGSGTTLLVARRMGRSAIGLDLSFAYLNDQAKQRIGLNAPCLFP